MVQPILYKDFAEYYDKIYYWKDYKKEVALLLQLIRRYKKSEGKLLLEVACGTGKHLQYLHKRFSCTGIDLNKEILAIARKRVKNVKFKQGNMINFTLNQQFDIITCLFSSIAYVKTEKNLKRTLDNFVHHLKPGGVLIIEPWFTKKTYIAGSPHLQTYEDADLKIARSVIAKRKDNLSIMNMHYLVAQRDKKVQYFVEKHEMALFDTTKTINLLKKAGCKVIHLKHAFMKDRGAFIAIKPLEKKLKRKKIKKK